LKNLYLVLLFLVILGLSARSENTIPVLLDSIAAESNPTKKANFYRLLANEYRSVSPKRADSVARIGLDLARTEDHQLLQARLLFQLGNIYRQQSLFASALQFYQDALVLHLQISEEHPKNRIRVAYTHNQMGLVYKARGEYDRAIESYQKALAIKEEFRREHGAKYIPTTVNTYTNIGAIYNLLEEWQFALNYHLMGEELLKKNPEKYALSRATIFANLSHTYLNMDELVLAEEYLEKQYALIEELQDEVIEAEYHANFADIQHRKGLFEKSVSHYQKAIQNYRKLEDTYQVTWNQYKLGIVYECSRQPQKAINIYEVALQQARDINAGQLISEGLLRISQWHENRGELEKALKIYKEHIEQKALIFNEKTVNALKEMEVIFAPDKSADKLKLMELNSLLQEKQIEQNRLITSIVVIGLILAMVLSVILFKNVRNKRKANQLLGIRNEELSVALEELSIANSTKNKMFSIVSHDLRGQLGGMISFTQLLKEQIDTFSQEEIKVFADEFHSSSTSLFRLMENLVQWAKAQMEEVEYTAEVFSLNQVVKENLELQIGRAQDKGISLETKLEGVIQVESDINMMNFVLRNLISNAVKFTHAGGKITVGARMEGEKVRISVKDTGVGIPEHIRKGLFNIKSHATTRGTKNEKGTGLGLLLCDEFARKMGSPLDLESEIGKGTTFSFLMKAYAFQAPRIREMA
jgi:signal transduction histidine kinase